jgi:hypothetical protein
MYRVLKHGESQDSNTHLLIKFEDADPCSGEVI